MLPAVLGFVLLGGAMSTRAPYLIVYKAVFEEDGLKRSIFMDKYVYSVARDLINVSEINDLENPVTAISLVNETEY